MSQVEQMEKKGEFVLLENNEAYRDYFGMLMRAFEVLIAWYRQTEGAGDEEKIIVHYLGRISYTLKLLALKCAYASHPTMRLDLNESGYPHALAIKGVEVDNLQKNETLLSLDTQTILKDTIINHLATSDEEPSMLLEAMSLRQYFERLMPAQMILPFTPGELIFKGSDEERRQYLYSWLYYDNVTSVPYVYILAFEQDVSDDPLEFSEPARREFYAAVKKAGSSVSKLQTIAVQIDDAMESIHPKILKRIKLGPVLTVKYSREEHQLLSHLREFGTEDDFIFHVRNEMVFSKKQIEKPRGFFSPSQVREVFAVPQDDLTCAEAGTSRVRRLLILPHYLTQHIDIKDPIIAKYDNLVSYTKQGEVHAI